MKKLMIVIVSSLIGSAAFASDDPRETRDWIKDAGASINKAMSYPMAKSKHRITGTASFEVTIDRAGNTVNYYADHSSGEIPLYKAAERALKMAHFPPIPVTFSGGHLTFTLHMSYSKQEGKTLRPTKTRIIGTRIALLDSTKIAAAK